MEYSWFELSFPSQLVNPNKWLCLYYLTMFGGMGKEETNLSLSSKALVQIQATWDLKFSQGKKWVSKWEWNERKF